MQYTVIFTAVKVDHFLMKNCDDRATWGGSYEFLLCKFQSKNKKTYVNHSKSKFYFIKVVFEE